MKFTNLLKSIIVESAKFDFLYGAYVKPEGKEKTGKLPFDIFKKLIFADPTTRPQNFELEGASVNDMTNVKPGGYSEWIIKSFLGKGFKLEDGVKIDSPVGKREFKRFQESFLEDLLRLKTALDKYERYKGSLKNPEKKNIHNVSSPEELYTLQVAVSPDETVDLESYRGKKIKKETGVESNKNFVVPGSEVLKVGKHFTLVKIFDKGELGRKAAGFFGGYHNYDKGESIWCTSPVNSIHFQKYINKGPLYVFLANDDKGKIGEITGLPQERYQVHFSNGEYNDHGEYKDRGNRDFDFIKFLLPGGEFEDLKEVLKPELAKGLTGKLGTKVHITDDDLRNSRNSVSTYVAIYGIDELLSQLPEDLEDIKISFKTDGIKIKIPETIDKFQNLNMLQFSNCIDSIPQSVCNLKNLRFLGVGGNKNLTEIPECIGDLPNLSFLNVKDCPNLKKIPKKILENSKVMGNGSIYNLGRFTEK